MATTGIHFQSISCDNLKTTCATIMVADMLKVLGYKTLDAEDITNDIQELEEGEKIYIFNQEERVWAFRVCGKVVLSH